MSLVLILASLGLLGVVLSGAQRFMEPAVEESLLAHKLALAFSGKGDTHTIQARGFKTGLRSWERWPEARSLAVAVGHFAQTRRRVFPLLGLLIGSLAIVLASFLARDLIPMYVGLIVVLLLVAVAAPSQALATDLDHQHLRLSGAPVRTIGVVAIFLNAVTDCLTIAPAVMLWSGLQFMSFGVPWTLLPAFFGYCVVASIAGIASRAFADAPMVRVVFSIALSMFPLLAVLSSLEAYEGLHDALRILVAAGATFVLASAIYGGLACIVVSEATGRTHSRGKA
ncbi:hypothetical protein [Leucobacter luti]|uniref:hypothetical protein n=1 Tax=Leucobacter luti TaxID=340320 RepID=UPI0010432833|nr:hypothetical protein [Leucobacter luti]MCW2287127.1 hypothetical protein [Leucobacter luti]